MYTAESTVQIYNSKPAPLSQQDGTTQVQVQDTNEQHDFYRTQYGVMVSRQLAAQVIAALGLQKFEFLNPVKPPGPLARIRNSISAALAKLRQATPQLLTFEQGVKPRVIDAYLRHLQIEPRMGTQLVVIGFSAPDPQLSAEIVNAHVRAYIERGVELNFESNRAVAEYLQKNLAELKDRVQKSEAALNAYRKARGIVSFSLQNGGEIMMGRLAELSSSLTKAEERTIRLGSEFELIQKHNYDALPEVRVSPLIEQLKQQVSALSAQYASMQNRYNPGYHPLDDLKARLNDSKAMLDRQVQDIVEGIQGDYQAALAQQANLKSEIDRIKAQALALKDDSIQDSVLSRDLDTNRRMYENVLKRIQEIQVTATVQTSNVSVIDEAQPPSAPSSPRIGLSLVLTSLLGLTAGLLSAFGLDYIDDRFKNKEEVAQYLRTPVLGVVPDFSKVSRIGYGSYRYASQYISHQRKSSNGAAVKSAGQDEQDLRNKEIVVTANQRASVASEMYRVVRTAIMFSQAGGAPKTVLFCSTVAHEGKTVSAINTAAAFAQLGRRTLLIDADLRRGRLHQLLEIENEIGLTQLLVGQCTVSQCIRATRLPGLSLISGGPRPPNPADLLGSRVMRELLVSLEADYDHIIIDSAPFIVSDPLSLSRIVDGVVLIVGAETPKQLVRNACVQLRTVGAKIFGVLVNRVDPFQHSYYAGYHYGRYSRYGYERYYSE
jgi:polysaccharide biosynthesis transport protein